MTPTGKPLAVITGASSGIGYELAAICAQEGFDLVIAADDPGVEEAANAFRGFGARVDTVYADLATLSGVDKLLGAVNGRPVDALLANAGHGLGGGFLDQDFDDVRHVVDTNVTGTIYLVQQVGPRDASARHWTHPSHGIDRRLHARDLPSGLQRHQGVHRFVFLRTACRVEGYAA